MKKLARVVLVGVVVAGVLVNSTPVFAAQYSCDTVTESFGPTDSAPDNTSDAGSSGSGDTTGSGNNIGSGSGDTTGSGSGSTTGNSSGGSTTSGSDSSNTGVNNIPDAKPDQPNQPNDNTAGGTPATDNTLDKPNTTTPTSGTTVKEETVTSGKADTEPALNSSVSESDGVSAAIRSNWTYSLNKKTKQIKLLTYIGKKSSVSVPNTVKVGKETYSVVVARNLFYGNQTVKKVSFGKKVRTAKGSAYKMFFGCKNLKTVKNLPWDITFLNKTFMGCENLTSVNGIPKSVVNANYAFNGCKNLKTVTLSDNLQKAYKAFQGCKKLTSVKGVSKSTANSIKGFYCGKDKSIVK